MAIYTGNGDLLKRQQHDVLDTFFFIAVNRYLFASVTDIREPSVHDLVPE